MTITQIELFEKYNASCEKVNKHDHFEEKGKTQDSKWREVKESNEIWSEIIAKNLEEEQIAWSLNIPLFKVKTAIESAIRHFTSPQRHGGSK